MTRRYFVPDLKAQAPVVQLPDEEASHAARVMRVQTGDAIELFDGSGNQCTAEVMSVSKRECTVRCDTIVHVNREPSVHLDLAIGLPKPDRAKELMERLTELGVSRVIPVVFERTQRPPADNLMQKLQRIVVEACKQSGRNTLMQLDAPIRFAELLTLDAYDWQTRLVAMPDSPPLPCTVPVQDKSQSQHEAKSSEPQRPRQLAVIGPEGGLSDVEHQQCLAKGFDSFGLGKRILRIETAATVIAARLLMD
ncbi:RsmE family RNA methyltransferase [Rhodopirellula halodulae]|uniref:RsmE family RNA methyltransferase n=1 Tax=Rhodopirellula halodulae TaxID=2894198 RepID=UPI001E501241|nr:RsmE family RNA methyltransferase [Rhodopirellula sp. JC737]MCC9654407.1 16S rRNA (uracil(1498)-N(3))-methyltransferase [Rhodopirellula sp. JC737]